MGKPRPALRRAGHCFIFRESEKVKSCTGATALFLPAILLKLRHRKERGREWTENRHGTQ